MDTVPLVEITRSGYVESWHRGAIAIVQNGKLIDCIGNPKLLVCERSTAKPFQLLSLLNRGGRERFALNLEEIAVMVSSHNGEKKHVNTVRNILAKCGLEESYLKCGVHPPFFSWITEEIFTETNHGPKQIHNNCSGKHAGMLLLCSVLGAPFSNYWKPDHPVQKSIAREVASAVNQNVNELKIGVDGCGVPTYFVSLEQLAGAYSKLAVASVNDEDDKLGIITKAMMSHPFMVAGTMRADTAIMDVGKPIIAKAGAQAVYCVAVPNEGIGIAIKIDSGCEEASESVAIEILMKLGIFNERHLKELDQFWHRPVYNCKSEIVGTYRIVF